MLEREILVMSSMVGDVIASGCQAVCLFDQRLFDGVAEQERLINEREVQVEELSLNILALPRPVFLGHSPCRTDCRPRNEYRGGRYVFVRGEIARHTIA